MPIKFELVAEMSLNDERGCGLHDHWWRPRVPTTGQEGTNPGLLCSCVGLIREDERDPTRPLKWKDVIQLKNLSPHPHAHALKGTPQVCSKASAIQSGKVGYIL
eukprot:12026318-Prorocentrum_lima.AAC.2